MNKFILTATSNHYLYPKLKTFHHFVAYTQDLKVEDGILVDFSITSLEEKKALIKRQAGNIICDLSLYDHRGVDCRAKFSSVFPSPNHKIEMVAKKEDQIHFMEFFTELGLLPLFVHDPGLSFNFPRILAQIINEAYFAMEENVALEKDIDTAMLYGVNYPKGPIEWGKSAGIKNVVDLLRMLEKSTGLARYKLSKALEKESLSQ